MRAVIQEDHGPISRTVVVFFYCLSSTSSTTTQSVSVLVFRQTTTAEGSLFAYAALQLDTSSAIRYVATGTRYEVPGIVIREDAAMGYRERGVARQGAEVRFSARLDGVSEGRSGDRFHQLRGGHEGQQWGKR